MGSAQSAYYRGDWDTYVKRMLEVQQLEPTAGDVQYEIAERYRLAGECSKALFYYNESLKIDDDFAPGYLGLARARLCSEPGANVLPLLELAQECRRGLRRGLPGAGRLLPPPEGLRRRPARPAAGRRS